MDKIVTPRLAFSAWRDNLGFQSPSDRYRMAAFTRPWRSEWGPNTQNGGSGLTRGGPLWTE